MWKLSHHIIKISHTNWEHYHLGSIWEETLQVKNSLLSRRILRGFHQVTLDIKPIIMPNLTISVISFIVKRYLFSANKLLTLSWRRPLSYRNQSVDLRSKSMDCFLHDNCLRHERVKHFGSNWEVLTLLSSSASSSFWIFYLL